MRNIEISKKLQNTYTMVLFSAMKARGIKSAIREHVVISQVNRTQGHVKSNSGFPGGRATVGEGEALVLL